MLEHRFILTRLPDDAREPEVIVGTLAVSENDHIEGSGEIIGGDKVLFSGKVHIDKIELREQPEQETDYAQSVISYKLKGGRNGFYGTYHYARWQTDPPTSTPSGGAVAMVWHEKEP